MSFGKNLKEKKIIGRIFHSCTLDGLANIIQNFKEDEPICFSTSHSRRLFGRECVLILDGEFKGEYDTQDADAGRNYGWDEFRCSFSSFEEFEKHIVAIVMTDDAYDYVSFDDTDSEEDARALFTNEDGDFNEEEYNKREWFNTHIYEEYAQKGIYKESEVERFLPYEKKFFGFHE